MTDSPDPRADAFRALRRRLVRRRIAALEPALRVELALLAALLGGFVFLEVRGPFEIVVEQRGPWALAGAVALAGALLAALALGLVAARHVRRLAHPAGPAWLALPLEPAALARHLAWESRLQAGWVVVPALAVLVAAIGLLPAARLAAVAALVVLMLVGAARAGTAVGLARALRATAPRPGATDIERVLFAAGAGRAAAVRRRPPRWRRLPPAVALMAKDARVLARHAGLRRGALVVAALGVVSLLGWLLPADPGAAAATGARATFDYRNLATFFVTLLCAAALAEELVRLVGSDPFVPLRSLPIGLGAVWGARVAWAGLVGAVLVAGHVLLSGGLTPGARLLFAFWVFGVVVGIGALGVQFALSLHPRVEAAGRLLGLSFLLMAIASLAFFLSGWAVLVGLLVFTARRLRRWERAEP